MKKIKYKKRIENTESSDDFKGWQQKRFHPDFRTGFGPKSSAPCLTRHPKLSHMLRFFRLLFLPKNEKLTLATTPHVGPAKIYDLITHHQNEA